MSDFTEKEVSQFKVEFDAFDSDKDGHIDEKDLATVFQKIGQSMSVAELKQLIESVDTDHSGTVEFPEFLEMIRQSRKSSATSGGGSGGGKDTAFGTVYKKTSAHVVAKQSAGGGQHAYTQEEKEAFVEHINSTLGDDKDLQTLLPIDPQSEDLFEKTKDGLLLCKLINSAVKDTIDERVINKKPKNAWERNENHELAINSAKGIGCSVVNIGAVDISEGRPHLVLGLVWQIIRIGLLSQISLVNHPELVRLLEEGETLEDLLKLPPEQLLLRWFNYQLKQANHPRKVNNFSGDIKDSECYIVLLHQISPDHCCDKSPLDVSDTTERAEKMLEQADKIQCRKFVTSKDVVAGNPKLNLAFVANLFNTYPALDPVDEADYAKLLEFNQEGTREERAFRFWIQSLGLDCNNLYEDLSDGLLLLKVIDKVQPGIVDWKKVNMNASNKYKKVENCNYAVVLGKQMKFSLVNIGGPDIVDKNKKLILAIVWQLMRQSIINMLKTLSSDGKEVTDQDILKWANEKVKSSGRNSKANSFQDSNLKTGVFLCDVCHAVSPRSVNVDLITPGETAEDAEMNAKYAISVARKLGCAVFLLWEDIVEVKPKMILTLVASLMVIDKQGKH